MASISGSGSSSSFATVTVTSLNSPESTVTLDSISFLPGLEAHRKIRAVALVGTEQIEIILELLDEVFETETLDGKKKEPEGKA